MKDDMGIMWDRVPCDSGACYEVAVFDGGVLMRSSEQPEFCMAASLEETRTFRDAVKAGFLDHI